MTTCDKVRLEDLPLVRHGFTSQLHTNDLIKILLINPNSNEHMTRNCLESVKAHIPMDTIVYGYTAPMNAPISVEGHLDSVLSSAIVFKDVYPLITQVDACLVSCFSDHPLTICIREEFDNPACGIMEAALYSARIVGGRFGIITTVYRSQIRHSNAVNAYGLEHHCAGLISTGLKVKELEEKPKSEVLTMMKKAANLLIEEKDADVLILGCAGMSKMREAIEESVSHKNVQVIDGVVAGVNILSGVVRAKLKTSKRGLFSSSIEARMARNQEYF